MLARTCLSVTATPRKANRFANQSISQPETGSPLKAAAHKALERVAKADTEAPSPSSGSTTQDAFAKFRAMVSMGRSHNRVSHSPRMERGLCVMLVCWHDMDGAAHAVDPAVW